MPFQVEAENYKVLQSRLRAADPALKKQFTKEVRSVASKVVVESRAKASWSKTIPPAIGTSVTAGGVGVRVSRKKSTIAVLNEFGPWRHPLFGNRDHWYEQKSRPSVTPTVEANRSSLLAAAARATQNALQEVGL